MRLLIEAIIASLGHYANTLEIEVGLNPLETAEFLDIEPDSKRFAEIEKLSREIRENMGISRTKARRLLELLKYRTDD